MTVCVLGKANCRSCQTVDDYYARRRPTPPQGRNDLAVPGGTSSRDASALPGSPVGLIPRPDRA